MVKSEIVKTLQDNTGIKHILPGTLHISKVEGNTIEESYLNYREMFLKCMICPFCLEEDMKPEQCVLVKIVFKRNRKSHRHPYYNRNITRAHYSCVQGEMCYCDAIKNGRCEFCDSEPKLSKILKHKKDSFFYTVQLM